MVPSWMLVPAPTWMWLVSPRSTQWHQTLTPAPSTTLPITVAVGATQPSGATCGATPSSDQSGPPAPDTGTRPDSAPSLGKGEFLHGVQAEHQAHVLHRGARCALAEVVQPGDQHGMAVGGVA